MPNSVADTPLWAALFERKLKSVAIKQFTGYEGERWRGVIPPLRRGRYYVLDQPVSGDAPKDFIRVYEKERGRRRVNPPSWPAYIAKVGHKWYPAESITEQLMTCVGKAFGLKMAESRLMSADGQVRFLSRYFLESDESLDHGAEIVAGYLEDPKFIEAVEQEHLEKEIFTFQVLCEAIRTRFPQNGKQILLDFVRMIAFDALVGNQDRHLYNWGVIVHPKGRRPPVFSPIYDTARGLFWNQSDSRLGNFRTRERLLKYVESSHPLIGWDGSKEINHFDLIGNIAHWKSDFRTALSVFNEVDPGRIDAAIDDDNFRRLLSWPRRDLIRRCVRLRLELYAQAVRGGEAC